MKESLKLKFLQFLSLKKKDQGFTLIELLVVIIIVGILSAIALPSFLNQRSKAKQTEAETQVSAINTQQNAFFTEFDEYATNFASLAIGSLTSDTANETTDNYKYTIATVNGVTGDSYVLADATQGSVTDFTLKSYTGATNVYLERVGGVDQAVFGDVMCITTGANQVPDPPASAPTDTIATCSSTMEKFVN